MRLLVLNQYYWPGVEATAHILTELCEGLADGREVHVITGTLHAHEDEPHRAVRNGVSIRRIRSTSFDRSRLTARASNYFTYLAGALWRGITGKRPDIVVSMTDPPMVGAVALAVARRFRVPLVVICQDVFPETAVRLGRLTNPFVVGVLRRIVRSYLRRADRVVAIGETMRERLIAKGTPAERIVVIPNWTDTAAITPTARDNGWAHTHDLVDRFVVMHSGNVGHAQDLETLVRAAALLEDLERLEIVVIGFGARHAAIVALAREVGATNVRFLPYQPREVLHESLAAADLHFVGLAPGLAGFVVPSRLYGVLAAGRPVLVSADETSETVHVVRSAGCGIVVPPRNPGAVAAAIRAVYEGACDVERLGRAGRTWVEQEGGKARALARYEELLCGLLER